jgi:MoaA/NifB/PqqE/SkfB family radical SAM enzyme
MRKEILETGEAPEPTKATLELTMRCNLKCLMCHRDKENHGELATEDIKKVIDNLSSVKNVHLTGGEVFLRSDVFEILDYLRDKKVSLNTNGTLLTEDKVSKLLRYDNITRIGLSLDGLGKTHNEVRGLDGAFDRTVKAIRLITQYIPVSVNSVVIGRNLGELEDLMLLASDLSAEEFRIELEMFSTPGDIKESREILASNGCRIVTQIKERSTYDYSLHKFLEVKERLKRISHKNGIKLGFGPKAADIDAREFYRGKMRESKRLICKHLLSARVDPSGNLVFCHIIKKGFGSLVDEPLEEIWNSEELRGFRKRLLRNNLVPVCERCCRLRST